jgi:hypothetical protein
MGLCMNIHSKYLEEDDQEQGKAPTENLRLSRKSTKRLTVNTNQVIKASSDKNLVFSDKDRKTQKRTTLKNVLQPAYHKVEEKSPEEEKSRFHFSDNNESIRHSRNASEEFNREEDFVEPKISNFTIEKIKDEKESHLEKYTIISILEDNRDKKIFKAMEKESNDLVRIIQYNYLPENNKRYIIPDVEGCKQIEPYIEVYETATCITLIQVYRNHNSLRNIFNYLETESQLMYVFFQILSSVAHLHKQGITDNNLSLDSFNVISNFNNEFFNIRLFDYNVYEVNSNERDSSDFMQLAKILYCLVFQKFPLNLENIADLKINLETKLSKQAISLFSMLYTKQERTTLEDLLSHEVFQNYNLSLVTVNVLNNSKILRKISKYEDNINPINIRILSDENFEDLDSKLVTSANFIVVCLYFSINEKDSLDQQIIGLNKRLEYLVEYFNSEFPENTIEKFDITRDLISSEILKTSEDLKKVILNSLFY